MGGIQFSIWFSQFTGVGYFTWAVRLLIIPVYRARYLRTDQSLHFIFYLDFNAKQYFGSIGDNYMTTDSSDGGRLASEHSYTAQPNRNQGKLVR